jgi:1-deoxy-D-xylulose-5-phosphate synthase
MSNYLDAVNQPSDIKHLSENELMALSEEIRAFIISNVLETGGHLASSLGAVDLTLALHYVFNSPTDKLIFDVGHQAYAHKIISGRKDQFSTLRKYKGLSGFLKPYESEHDAFAAGHCSTSISAGMGMVRARELSGDDFSVVSIIGDGALTGGMAYEGLNDAGHAKSKFIIVLNDNAMSIAENVGALHRYFSGLRANAGYIKFKKGIAISLKKIPLVGKTLYNFVEKAKRRLKYLFVKGAWFEELGFTYIGVVDGHDIDNTIKALEKAKKADKPVIVHVHTNKGNGYAPAENDPEQFHGVSANSAVKSTRPSNSDVFGNKLQSLAKTNEKIVAVSAAMPKGTGLDGFKAEFSDRFFDVGIAEQHGVTMCAGIASQGFIPVFAVYSSFLQRAYDQVLHDVCLQNLPVIFAVDRAGLVGEDGETHHGVYDISFLSHIPNLIILSPSSKAELESMVEYAIKIKKPVAIRYPRGSFERDNICNIDDAINWEEVQKAANTTVIASGIHVKTAMDAFKSVPFGLYNARCIKPLDANALEKIAGKSTNVVIIEDHAKVGGLGSLVESYFNEKDMNVNVIKMGIPDEFVAHGSVAELNDEIGLDETALVKMIKSLK